MVSINFISAKESVSAIENNQIASTRVNSQYGKITRITYLNLDKADIDAYNRRSDIKFELFTVSKASTTVLEEFKEKLGYMPSEFLTLECYHTRHLKFETMVPTNQPHLLNYRYFDEDGRQYFTVVRKTDNQICEAGFIEKSFFNPATGVVIDIPQNGYDQFRPFLQARM